MRIRFGLRVVGGFEISRGRGRRDEFGLGICSGANQPEVMHLKAIIKIYRRSWMGKAHEMTNVDLVNAEPNQNTHLLLSCP